MLTMQSDTTLRPPCNTGHVDQRGASASKKETFSLQYCSLVVRCEDGTATQYISRGFSWERTELMPSLSSRTTSYNFSDRISLSTDQTTSLRIIFQNKGWSNKNINQIVEVYSYMLKREVARKWICLNAKCICTINMIWEIQNNNLQNISGNQAKIWVKYEIARTNVNY